VVLNKALLVRIYCPDQYGLVSSITAWERKLLNVIVMRKAEHLQYLGMDEAIIHCTKGIGAGNLRSDQGASQT